jgi:hypothetical protein
MNWREDKTLILLSFFTVFFAGITLYCAIKLPDDGQTFTLFSAATMAMVGCLQGWVKPPEKTPPPGSTTTVTTQQEQVTNTPPQKPEGL